MSKQKEIINTLLVYLLIFISGSWRYNLSSEPYLLLAFFFSTAAWYLFSDGKISEKFILYLVVFAGFLFLISLYTGGSLTAMAVISTTMKMVIAYLVLLTVGTRFVETYIRVVVFLAVISLFGYLSDTYRLFDGLVYRLPPVGDLGYEGMFYVYRFSDHISRNNSIFFEPGAYQFFLNGALFLVFFTKTEFSNVRKWAYITILLITLITTFSTTGFIIFAVMFVLFLFKSDILSYSGKVILSGIVLAVISAFAAQFHSTFVVKINNYLTADEYDFGYSAQARSAGFQTDLKLFKKHIFGIGTLRYMEEFSAAGRTTKTGGSNGVTRILVVYGLPFGLFIFLSYFLALKKLLADPVMATGAFGMFLMFLWGQSYYSNSPISFAIIAGAFVASQVATRETPMTIRKDAPQ